MEKTDLAYIAGILDGEGCISICKQRDSTRRMGVRYQLRILVANSEEWLLNWLKFSFGGRVYKAREADSTHKACWRWIIDSHQALEFLKLVYPYLHLKRGQVELALTFQQAKKRGYHTKKHKTDEEFALEEAQALLMKGLNKRGRNEQSIDAPLST